MSGNLAIVGAGIHPFGRNEDVSGLAMGVSAARAALADAGISWADIQFAVGGSDSAGKPDTMVSRLGLTGLPFTNVINGCATGGASLVTARAAIAAGQHEIGLVVGFDKHPRGAFDPRPEDWGLGAWYGELGLMLTTQYFGIKIQRYMHDHAITTASLARVAAKAFRNGERNPAAWRRKPLTGDDILASPMVADPLTQYMFCSPSAGAVALVVCHPDLAARFPAPPVYVRAVSMRSRRFGSFEVFSPSMPVTRGPSPSQEAAQAAYAEAGIGPGEFDVVQVQDTESGAELMHLAECGLCEHGAQEELMSTGATEIGGRMPVNTDGGCIASGEPIGASGLRQVHETVLQLRGQAGARQVAGARTGFTHVYGAPGISACAVLSR
ncbi:MAG TPA: thiolase family protein [Streptosporangiaceae bacterium]|nr:thiolase family protein [Streptosporangiaceae bacterium]